MAMIEFDDLTKGYLDMPPVLDQVNLSIDVGEFFYLTGVSGAGKTTVFKLLMLMEQPTSGMIRFHGEALGNPSARQRAMHRRRIGMVFQDYKLLPEESVEENVALPLRICGFSRAEIRRRTGALLEQVGLSERRKDPAMVLSGGEKQLVSIARALTLEPDLVLADEPTGNLDHAMALKVMELLQTIHSSGRTVIVATHDIKLIRGTWARTLLIKDRTVQEVRLVNTSTQSGAASSA